MDTDTSPAAVRRASGAISELSAADPAMNGAAEDETPPVNAAGTGSSDHAPRERPAVAAAVSPRPAAARSSPACSTAAASARLARRRSWA